VSCGYFHIICIHHTESLTSPLLCVIFRVVPRRVVFNSRRFGTLCLFHLHTQVDISTCVWRWNGHSVPKRRLLNTTSRNSPKDYTQHSEHGECLKSRIHFLFFKLLKKDNNTFLSTANTILLVKKILLFAIATCFSFYTKANISLWYTCTRQTT
jgi:type IV secretory pathway VirB3-like protein